MRTLRRPMFRGGSTGTGITSGLDVPRQGYAHEPGHVVQDDWRKKKLRDVFGGEMTIGQAQELSKQMAYKPRGTNVYDFLTEFGLNIASMPPQGNIISTAAAAAKGPHEKFLTRKGEAEAAGYVSEADMFKTLIEAGATSTGGEGERWQKQWEANQIPGLVSKIAELEAKETLTNDEKNELQSSRLLLDKYSREDPFVEWFLKEPKAGLAMYKDIKEKLKIADEKSDKQKYDPNLGDDDPQLIADTFVEFRKQVRELRATGGRVGYANAGSVLPYRGHLNQGSPSIMSKAGTDTEVEDAYGVSVADAAMPEELSGISYEELRARLPQEVSDEIVRLLANSPEALEDFAVIQTEQDIANFNKKYGVNLVLPAGG